MAAAVVAAIALVIAGAVWMRARSSATSRTPAADASAADRSRLEGVTRIAVLPFANLGSAEDEYFAAGMAEEVTSRLAGVNRLAVPSSTTVNGYDRRGKSLHQIGTDLRVDYVVEGAVRWARGSEGSLVRITPKLIRVADDTTVWTQRYDASLSDVFKVQSDIAYQITGALEVALEAHERRSFEARPTANDEAYLAYLRGTATFRGSVRSSDTGRQMQARENLERAVTLDPQFAVAWSWLARVYAAQFRTGAQRTPQTMQAARDAARKAMALDPARPESHLALATVSLVDRDYDGALRELDVAGSSLPNSSDVLGQIGEVERRRGRWAESLTALKRAFNLDPARAAEALAVHYLHMRQYADADHFIGVARAADPLAVTVPEAWALFSGRGDVGGARRVLEAALGAISPEDARVRGLLARLEWFDGRYERALDLIHGMDPAGAWLPGNFRFPAALAAAQVYESMNRRDDAMTSYASAAATLEARWRSAADDYQVEAALGLAYAGLGRAPDAVRHGARAVQLLPVTKDASESPLYMYLLAQIHARLGQSAAAFARLDEMFSVPGFYSVVWVERDPGFARLRAHPRFREYLARWSSQTGDALLPSSARPNR
jgi:TolB-like protein